MLDDTSPPSSEPADYGLDASALGGDGSAPQSVWQRNISKRWLALAAAPLIVSFALLSSKLDSPWLAIGVGPAPAVQFEQATPDVTVSDSSPYRFTTAKVERLSFAGYLRERLVGDRELLYAPPESDRDLSARSLADMEESKRLAYAVAYNLTTGGMSASFGAKATEIAAGSPAEQAGVQVGDRIVAVDGTVVRNASGVAELVQAAGGRAVTLDIERADRSETVTLQPVRLDGDWRIGVRLATAGPDEDPPYRIDSGGVGGPSAGLMFTVAYVDALGEGSLAGGKIVAGTGTIDSDGEAGEVGAVDRKVEGAIAGDADVFFVPNGEFAQAQDAAGDAITVVGVDTAADAVAWLCEHGGDDGICAR